MQFYVNQEKCVACGRCTEICPEVFRLKEDKSGATKSVAYQQPLDAEILKRAQKAADGCPVEAIQEID